MQAQLEDLAFKALDSILDRDDFNDSDRAIVYGGAQFLDSAATARELLAGGYTRGSVFAIRSMIESFAVLEYVYADEEGSRNWCDAKSTSERRAFEFRKVYKHTARSDQLKQMWDTFTDKTHTNQGAFVTQSRPRLIIGFDTWVGPMYDPPFLATNFLIVLSLTQWFVEQLRDWYGSQPSGDKMWLKGIASVRFLSYSRALQDMAKREGIRVNAECRGSMTLEEQQSARARLDTLARELGKEPMRFH